MKAISTRIVLPEAIIWLAEETSLTDGPGFEERIYILKTPNFVDTLA